ncbi:MAG TPA: hypothetical protein VGM57_15210 [Pseudolabrys sp.]
MLRSLGFAIWFASAAFVLLSPVQARSNDRTLPMRFELRQSIAADVCDNKCEKWISATGAITADSARDFLQTVKDKNVTGATVVLDSDGGSVIGAIALGREIRKLSLNTTVGRVVDLPPGPHEESRTALLPRADCESMCAFVLLAGVQRSVPAEAHVMVHQIWLGDRREDPTAATYSAEDLVLVQRDVGRLARYTADMGASAELLDLALRIPPWEPMHSMTRQELRDTKLATDDVMPAAPAAVAATPVPALTQPTPRVTDGARASPISNRRWAMVDRAGTAALARRHPLTVEGEDIGSFDLVLACGEGAASYDVNYVETRRVGEQIPLPQSLSKITMRIGSAALALKVSSSERRNDPDQLVTYASASLPASVLGSFASVGNRSIVVGTESKDMITVIRLGNTGAQGSLPQLAESCRKGAGDRAELARPKIGGYAAAQ